MNELLAVAAVVTVAALTPGPNNLVVLRAAARGGARAAVPAVVGVVAGSLGLLAVVLAGAGPAFTALPPLRGVLAIGGGVYLAWLGVRLATPRPSPASVDGADADDGALPRGTLGLFAFQFLNPKAWVMTLTAVAAAGEVGGGTVLGLAVLFSAIPALALATWSLLGAALAGVLCRPRARRAFDTAMGVLLLVSAATLVVTP